MLKPFAIDGDKMQTIFNHFNLIKLYTCKGMKDLDCNSVHYHWLNNVVSWLDDHLGSRNHIGSAVAKTGQCRGNDGGSAGAMMEAVQRQQPTSLRGL